MRMQAFNKRVGERGATLAAALIAVLLLASLGLGVAYFSASNQALRVQQVTSDQSFYSVQAGMEFALAKILKEGATDIAWTPTFSAETVTVARSEGQVSISAPKGEAESMHTITDPNPPGSLDCLEVDIAGAYIDGNNKLKGIDLRRNASCSEILVLTSMTGTSWTPDDGEHLNAIDIGDSPHEFVSPPDSSGGTFNFSNLYSINDDQTHSLQRVQWNANISNTSFELHFHYTYHGENKTKIVTVDDLEDDD